MAAVSRRARFGQRPSGTRDSARRSSRRCTPSVGCRGRRRRRCRRCRDPGRQDATRANRSGLQASDTSRCQRLDAVQARSIVPAKSRRRARDATARTTPGAQVGAVEPIVSQVPPTVPARSWRPRHAESRSDDRADCGRPARTSTRRALISSRDRGQRRIVDVDDDGRRCRQPAQRRAPLRRRSCRALHSGRVGLETDC